MCKNNLEKNESTRKSLKDRGLQEGKRGGGRQRFGDDDQGERRESWEMLGKENEDGDRVPLSLLFRWVYPGSFQF